MAKQSKFDLRYKKKKSELRWLYYELYQNEFKYNELIRAMKQAFGKRKDSLDEWGDMLSLNGTWYRHYGNVGYDMSSIEIKKDGESSFIQYLNDHNISFISLKEEDLDEEMIKSCHENGIAIATSLTVNHTSALHPWALKAKQGEEEYIERYYFFDNWDIPVEFEKSLDYKKEGHFTKLDERMIVMTLDDKDHFDLNYTNVDVFNLLIEKILRLLVAGVDVICLEGVSTLWKRLGTNCIDLPQDHTILRLIRMIIDVVSPSTLLLCDRQGDYFGSLDKPECQIIFDRDLNATLWHTVATRDTRLMCHHLTNEFKIPKDKTYLHYLRNNRPLCWSLNFNYLAQLGNQKETHKQFLNDYFTGQRWESMSLGTIDKATGGINGNVSKLAGLKAARLEQNAWKENETAKLMIMLYAFIFTLRGIPVIMSGDEAGLTESAQMTIDQISKANDVSRLNKDFTRLLKVRQESPIFDHNADLWLVPCDDPHLVVIGRYYNDEKMIAIFNFDLDKQSFRYEDEEAYVDMFTKKYIDTRYLTIGSHDFIWLINEKNDTEDVSAEEKED